MANDDWWTTALTELFDGRRVILAAGLAAQWTPVAAEVRRFGATDVLVVATGGAGAGPMPEARLAVVDATVGIGDEMARIRATMDAVSDPPSAIVEAIEAFDPDREAVVIGAFLGTVPTLCGRPFVAHRRPEWVALEDKTIADGLFDAAGVIRAPSIVVPVADAASRRREVDAGAGTVWAVDATQGFHGGGAGTRWVVDDGDAARISVELGRRGTDVRVMPFLDGIATSIHGIVLPDGVAVLRPVELVTLRRGRDLVYAGCATFWDPSDAVRGEMRSAARRVGELLRLEVDFRGAFTIDGVATADGWRPTELNPRNGAGLNVIVRGIEGLPLQLLLDLVVAGRGHRHRRRWAGGAAGRLGRRAAVRRHVDVGRVAVRHDRPASGRVRRRRLALEQRRPRRRHRRRRRALRPLHLRAHLDPGRPVDGRAGSVVLALPGRRGGDSHRPPHRTP